MSYIHKVLQGLFDKTANGLKTVFQDDNYHDEFLEKIGVKKISISEEDPYNEKVEITFYDGKNGKSFIKKTYTLSKTEKVSKKVD